MKTLLRIEKLQVGDVILTTTSHPTSLAIRKATKSDISHAMLCVDTASVIDATGEGVHARNIQRIFLDDDRAVHVLRLKTPPRPSDVRAICEYVRHRIGTAYATREAIQTVVGGSDVWSQKQFCSRLVAQAFQSCGYKLVGDPNYCSPDDLLKSDMLKEVPDCTRPATPEDIQHTASRDLPQAMIDATAAFIEGAKKVKSNILSVNDIDKHLIDHPEDDKRIHDALVKSGYLSVWQLDVDRAPWHYDLALMETIANTEKLKIYCRMTVADAGDAQHRFAENARGYRKHADRTKLNTFEELFNLYQHLFDLHTTRLRVAAEWLSKNDPEAPVPIVHAPNSGD